MVKMAISHQEIRAERFVKKLEHAIKQSGSGVALARELECTPQTISNWRKSGIARATGHSRDALQRLAQFLGYAGVQDLFEKEMDPSICPNHQQDRQDPKNLYLSGVVHRELIRVLREIIDSPRGESFFFELFESPDLGPGLVRKILEFNFEKHQEKAM
jgi:hypothetical protein